MLDAHRASIIRFGATAFGATSASRWRRWSPAAMQESQPRNEAATPGEVAGAAPSQRAQALVEVGPFAGFGLQTLHELQTAHQTQALGLHVGRARAAPMLGIETPNPGLVKLCRFAEEPLCRQRLAVGRLHWSSG